MNDLSGLSVVVTRPRHQIDEFSNPLRDLGARVIEIPVIEIADPADGGAALRRALENIQTYDWCVFTSANAVDSVFEYLDAVSLHGVQVAAIGTGTADALADYGIYVDLIPEEFVAESLVAAIPEAPVDGGNILLPRAAFARDVLPDGLRAKAWTVDVVDAYQTIELVIGEDQLENAREADVITFTSPSAVRSFLKGDGAAFVPKTIACIGPITEKELLACGFTPDVVAHEHTIAGLIKALVEWRKSR